MWQMLQQSSPEDFVVATGKTHSLEEFVDEAFRSAGLNWQEHVVFDKSLRRPSEISVGRANPQKAKDVLGWQASYEMKDVVRLMLEAETTGCAV
jgi:GDPmannose 4,6-dehydratase